MYKKIYKQIKKYNKIILARHIGPDPDALGSTLGLKEAIKNTFSEKEVYVVGTPAARHRYMGELDKYTPDMAKNSLLIVLDTPDIKRIDGIDPSDFEYVIKIDHHPKVDDYANLEIVDTTASSASQLVIELIKNTRLVPNKKCAENLYIGVVADTERFLHAYTTTKTFDLVSYIIKETGIDFTKLYENMYLRSLDDLKFECYVLEHLILTENGFGYLKIDQKILDKYGIDAATATNKVNNLTYIDKMYSWALFVYDKANDNIRVSIRSRGPIINETAAKYNGGGHAFASGARLKDFKEADLLINALDLVCREYIKKK